jgi:MFS superfamily sulfate permease-like transporter
MSIEFLIDAPLLHYPLSSLIGWILPAPIVVSGMTVGFTGSYIFSQTIFTYRTGCKSRWIGILVALSFFAVVWSTVNVLQVTPLFFLGSTLIFIGFDLLYEWVSQSNQVNDGNTISSMHLKMCLNLLL